MFNTQKMSNRQWAHIAIADFKDASDKLVNLAIHLPENLADSAFEYADTLESIAYRLETAINGKSAKKQSKVISEFRRVFSDNVLDALEGFYTYLEQFVDYKAVFAPVYPEFEID